VGGVERHARGINVADYKPRITLLAMPLLAVCLVIVLDAERSYVACHQGQVGSLVYRDDVIGACRTRCGYIGAAHHAPEAISAPGG